MGIEFQIRPMTAADIDAVFLLAAHLDTAPHWPRAVYRDGLDPGATPRRIFLIAEDKYQRVVGFAVAALLAPQAELESIAVAADLHREGIGRALVERLLVDLKPLKISEMILEVRSSNQPALGLYAAMGFAQSGRRKGYYTDPVEDAVLLSRAVQ